MSSQPTLNPADVALLIGAMKVVFPTRDELGEILDKKLEEKLGRLPTKEEFAKRMDKLSGEYKKIDEAETLHAGGISEIKTEVENHDDRITVLEKRHTTQPSAI